MLAYMHGLEARSSRPTAKWVPQASSAWRTTIATPSVDTQVWNSFGGLIQPAWSRSLDCRHFINDLQKPATWEIAQWDRGNGAAGFSFSLSWKWI